MFCPRASTKSATPACGTPPGASRPPEPASCCNSIAQQHRARPRPSRMPPIRPLPTYNPTVPGFALIALRGILSASGIFLPSRPVVHDARRHPIRATPLSPAPPSQGPRQAIAQCRRRHVPVARSSRNRSCFRAARTAICRSRANPLFVILPEQRAGPDHAATIIAGDRQSELRKPSPQLKIP